MTRTIIIIILLAILSGCAPAGGGGAYLPYISSNWSMTATRLGGYWCSALDTRYIVPHQWIRYTLDWSAIEAERGVYTWNATTDTIMDYCNRHNNPVMVNIHRSPAWARGDGYRCSLPTDNADLVRFVLAAIDRYHVEAVEIWNEVETSGAVSAQIDWCCGCASPQEYNSALSAVYEAVKAAYPEVLVVGGSLLSVDSAWSNAWLALFPKMDAVTFHYYRNYGQSIDAAELAARIATLEARTSAAVWLGETSLLCDPASGACGDDFRLRQADWLRAVLSTDADKVFWYSQTDADWMSCNMVEYSGTYPAFDVFREAILP